MKLPIPTQTKYTIQNKLKANAMNAAFRAICSIHSQAIWWVTQETQKLQTDTEEAKSKRHAALRAVQVYMLSEYLVAEEAYIKQHANKPEDTRRKALQLTRSYVWPFLSADPGEAWEHSL